MFYLLIFPNFYLQNIDRGKLPLRYYFKFSTRTQNYQPIDSLKNQSVTFQFIQIIHVLNIENLSTVQLSQQKLGQLVVLQISLHYQTLLIATLPRNIKHSSENKIPAPNVQTTYHPKSSNANYDVAYSKQYLVKLVLK